ncbi:MAG: ATP-binding protein [Treponema sp.]|nr:ATP-binding protein [Treponema sp.]
MAVKVTSLKEWDIKRIIDGIGQPNVKAVIYFFSLSLEKHQIHKELTETFPGAVCIGASMHGGWSSNGAVKTGITIMSLSGDEVDESYVTFQEGVKKDPTLTAHNAIKDLKHKTQGHQINPDEYLGIIFFDGLCLGELIIKEFTMEKDLNMAFIGGAAADEMTFTGTQVCANDKISSDGLVAVILKMKIPFFFNHYVHYLPTDTSFTITRVEIMKRIAWEINGEPAAEFYARNVGVKNVKDLTMEVFARHPLGLILGDSVYIRSPNLVVGGTGLQFYCYIEAGTKVFLLKQGDIIENAQASIRIASQFLPGIQGCLLFNCVQRHLELVEKDLIDSFNNVFSKYPMIGFNTYGEELFTHHNQTLTAVFFGTLPEEGMTDPYKAKRLFHYTDSKLKSLVFDIVSRSELLNITISYLKGSMDAENDETALANFESIRLTLGAMIEQSNISKEDIERMLIVYQNNVEKTGEYVFNIVDEIRTQNRRLVELREEAEMANRTKSSFLASMSHEIRTPMNAITGMAELLMRSDLSDEARSYAQDIKQAGNNLISIINDILDFSKIEAGKIELINVRYLLASLINDTVNIIRTRLKNKPIRFYTNIDGQIPHSLFGDEARIRQILLNLLSNAAKYTEKGFISLTISVRTCDENVVWLDFSIADTGRGIKPEDQKKLFSEFVQVDLKRNRNLDGTGLGLAITKRLCILMGGNISMNSEYGKGSIFNVSIPQCIDTSEPFAAVDNADKKKVLVFEGRVVYAKSICWSLRNLGVHHTMVTNIEDFKKALFKEEWTLVLSGYGIYEKIMKVMDKPDANYPGGKKPPLALMVEWGTEAFIPDVRFVSLPIQSLSIANILNGKEERKSISGGDISNIIRYAFPEARILVVDDIETNLRVSKGLLAPYQSTVDICLNGLEAIELFKRNEYDVIFMDHMMPEMDGIEVASVIRDLEKDSKNKRTPIVALTANAVFGVREMFIEKNFDDFLAKPIDVSALDDILCRWISKDKREDGSVINNHIINGNSNNNGSILKIEGIDTEKGIKMTGGTKEGYIAVLSIFCKDSLERMKTMPALANDESLSTFVVYIHAVKSAAAAIGAQYVSAEAAKLEVAGRENDKTYIKDNLERFFIKLTALISRIDAALEADKPSNNNGITYDIYNSKLILLLQRLEIELRSKKADNIDIIINEISHLSMNEKTKDIIEKISENILMTEFEKAIKIIEDLLNSKH